MEEITFLNTKVPKSDFRQKRHMAPCCINPTI